MFFGTSRTSSHIIMILRSRPRSSMCHPLDLQSPQTLHELPIWSPLCCPWSLPSLEVLPTHQSLVLEPTLLRIFPPRPPDFPLLGSMVRKCQGTYPDLARTRTRARTQPLHLLCALCATWISSFVTSGDSRKFSFILWPLWEDESYPSSHLLTHSRQV